MYCLNCCSILSFKTSWKQNIYFALTGSGIFLSFTYLIYTFSCLGFHLFLFFMSMHIFWAYYTRSISKVLILNVGTSCVDFPSNLVVSILCANHIFLCSKLADLIDVESCHWALKGDTDLPKDARHCHSKFCMRSWNIKSLYEI